MTVKIMQLSIWRKSNHSRRSFLSWTENIIQRLLTFTVIITNDLWSVDCKKVGSCIIGTGRGKRSFPCSRWTIKKNTFVSEINKNVTKLKERFFMEEYRVNCVSVYAIPWQTNKISQWKWNYSFYDGWLFRLPTKHWSMIGNFISFVTFKFQWWI